MRQSCVATKVLGGVFAFCAFAFAPIDRASAGCGDYLTMDHGQSTSSDHVGSPLKPSTTPCNGPNCHRHDGPPLTPAPDFRPAPPTVKTAAIFADASADLNLFREHWPDEDARPLPGHI